MNHPRNLRSFSAVRLAALIAVVLAAAPDVHGRELLAPAARPAPIGDPRLPHLAEHVRGASAAHVQSFARIALTEMIREHEEALAGAWRSRARSAEEQAKLGRWAAATRGYLERLVAMLEALDWTQASVSRSHDGVIQVRVRGHGVVVSSVYIRTPERLEGRIVDAFCARRDCSFLAAFEAAVAEERMSGESASAAKRVVAPAAGDTPRRRGEHGWSFGDGRLAVFTPGEGLHFMFSDLKERAAKERACRTVADELGQLARRLAAVKRGGHTIDWSLLRIDGLADGKVHRVVLDARGTFTRLPLPALAASPSLLRLALPWLEARAEGKSAEQFFPRAELFLGDLLSGAEVGMDGGA